MKCACLPFVPGSFRMANLLLFRPEIDLEQPAGIASPTVTFGDLVVFPSERDRASASNFATWGNRNLTGVCCFH